MFPAGRAGYEIRYLTLASGLRVRSVLCEPENGQADPRITHYRLEGDLEGMLGRSFPKPGDADRIRELFAASLADDRLGIATRRDGAQIRYGFPVAVLVADRA